LARSHVASLDEAKERHAAREAAVRNEADEHDALTRDIGDLTPSLVARHVAELEARVAAAPEEVDGLDAPSSLTHAEVALGAAEQCVASLLVTRDDQLVDERMARQRLDTVRVDDRVLEGRIGQVRSTVERLVDRLEAARAAASDTHLRAEVDDALDAV